MINTKVISFDGIQIEVIKKPIKNLYIRIYPPDGRVVISAPKRMSDKKVMAFVESKINWIRKQHSRLKSQSSTKQLQFIDGEQHYYCGNSYTLRVSEENTTISVACEKEIIRLSVRPGTNRETREGIMDNFYRSVLKEKIPLLITKWQAILNVRVNDFGIRKMKTRWGTCNIKDKRIWINLELAKQKEEILEYIIVHEMLHLIERKHNARFYSLMDKYLPEWKNYKLSLNS